jgi:glycosyltransferase involved in cell wall biosynthesis
VGGRAWSWVLPETTTPEGWTEFFLSVRENFCRGEAPVPPRPQSEASSGCNNEYVSRTLKKPSPGIVRERSTARTRVAAVISADPSSGQLQACAYVRVVCPLTHPSLNDLLRLNLISASSGERLQVEILLVQRAAVSDIRHAECILEHCRKYDGRLIYETDDDLLSIGPDHTEYAAYRESQRAARLLASEAHFVMVPTSHLATKLRDVNPRTLVVPNYLDERLWPLASNSNDRPNTIRFVYAGTSTHRDDLQILRDAMRRLRERLGNRIRLDVVGVSEGRQEDWFDTIPVPPVVASSYPRFAGWFRAQAARSGWHWGLAPLLDTPFNRSKSAIKVLEYAAAGIPAICSDVPPYADFVTHNQNGVVTSNESHSWFDALLQAAEDAACQERLYAGARELLHQNTLAANADHLCSIWKSLVSSSAASTLLQPPRVRDSKQTP